MQRIAAALDFGGTKVIAGLVDETGRVLDSERIVSPPGGPQAVASYAGDIFSRLLSKHRIGLSELVGLGSTVPGIADREHQVLRLAPAHGWENVPFATMLTDATGLPATITNDVNACVLAEQLWGSAHGARDLLWTTVSTGIGGAVIINGRLHEGRGGLAGEVGHLTVADGPHCGCGRLGCLEAVASGPAVARTARESGLAVKDAEQVFVLARAGEPRARQIVERAHAHLARAFSFAANLLDLDLIIVGGGVAQSLDIDVLQRLTLQHTMTLPGRQPAVRLTGLGYEAGLLGAAALAFKDLRAQ
jgi:glucokinase